MPADHAHFPAGPDNFPKPNLSLRGKGESGRREDPPIVCSSRFTIRDRNGSVHDHPRHAGRILVRGFEGCVIDHRACVDDGKVGGEAGANASAVAQPEAVRHLPGHPVDRILKRQDRFVAHVSPEDPCGGAIVPWMRAPTTRWAISRQR